MNAGAAVANNNSNNSNLNPVRNGNIGNMSSHNVVNAALTTTRKSPAPAAATNHRKRTVSRATLQQSAKKTKMDGDDGSDGEYEMMTKTIFSSYVVPQMRMMLMLMQMMVMVMVMQS